MKNIRFFSIYIIILLISHKCFCQEKKYEEQIFKLIINDFSSKNTGFYIECNKSSTSFNQNEFLEQTQLVDFPVKVVQELKNNSTKMNKTGKWSNNILKEIKIGEDLLKSTKCLSKEKIITLFKKEGKREKIIGISTPIFDNKREYCIVQVSVLYFIGSMSGSSFLLKKIYGKWVIIEEFGFWLS